MYILNELVSEGKIMLGLAIVTTTMLIQLGEIMMLASVTKKLMLPTLSPLKQNYGSQTFMYY